MKKIWLTCLLMLITVCVFAQSHTYDACCRYGKSNVTGDCICPACKKDKDDNNKALQEEAKQLQEKAAAEKAQKEAEIKKTNEDLAKKKEAEQKKKQNNTVYIEMPEVKKAPVKTVKETPLVKKGKSTLKTTLMFGGKYSRLYWDGTDLRSSNYFTDSNGDTILQNKTFLETHGASLDEHYRRGFPKNIGIIKLSAAKKYEGEKWLWQMDYPYTADIVDIKGNRLFNDENLKVVFHFCDDYFILRYGRIEGRTVREGGVASERIVIYNIKTKKSIELPKPDKSAWITLPWDISDKNLDSWDREILPGLKETGTYKCFMIQEMGYDYIVYYVMLDGTIDIQKIIR